MGILRHSIYNIKANPESEVRLFQNEVSRLERFAKTGLRKREKEDTSLEGTKDYVTDIHSG
jgi:hypothetical protein